MLPADIVTSDDYEFSQPERPVSAPLYQTSLFTYPTVEALRDGIKDEYSTHLYSRGNNPTVEQVEGRIARLEKGEKAKLFSAGVSAIAATILSNVKAGDHIICSNEAYTWAKYISSTYLGRFGVSVSFVDTTDYDAVVSAIRHDTKLLYLESPSSSFLRVTDLPAMAKLAKQHDITTIVDNTWATPLYQNPLEMGIDLVVHSASKYLGGHSDIVGGCAIGDVKRMETIFKTEFLPMGTVPDPFQAWLIQRGMRTLHVRVPYHYHAALEVCDFLYDHPKVEQVNYPMHPRNEWYHLASSQMSGGSGLLSLRLRERDPEKVANAVNHLEMFRIGVSWGGYESLVFPSLVSGGDPSMLRLHVGLEDTSSLLADLEQAFSYL